MCGIIGYAGNRDLAAVLLAGLERLSYRGYDSSGVSVIAEGELSTWKSAGKLQNLIDRFMCSLKIPRGSVGIAHTRWATHGKPNDANAHPHTSNDQKNAIVHNGIIENYTKLKNRFLAKTLFHSDTDTEVIVHLFAEQLKLLKNPQAAFSKALAALTGSYALALLCEEAPKHIFIARHDSPIIIGLGENENFFASDLHALLPLTRRFIHLADHEFAIISANDVRVFNADGHAIDKTVSEINVADNSATPPLVSKDPYPHFMLKEIMEQDKIIAKISEVYLPQQTISFPTLKNQHDRLKNVNRFIIQACGTSWHAGLIAKYWIEEFARIPTEVDVSSEFRYRRILTRDDDIVLALSQSGETADTLAGIREVKKIASLPVISFINRAQTTMERESDAVIPSLAGIEIGVASTKNYLAQLGTLFLFALFVADLRQTIDPATLKKLLLSFNSLPKHIASILKRHEYIRACAKRFASFQGFFFIGRGMNFPNALEGALKLKEISYLYAAGHAAGELKHGPIALIDDKLPVVIIIPKTSNYSKMMNNLEEVRSRSGRIIAITTEGDEAIKSLVDVAISIPDIAEELSPLLTVIPLQLFAYEIAVALDRDVDQPKNLAKSVTVE